MTGEQLTRRSVLSTAGSSVLGVLAGCGMGGSRRLRLNAYGTDSLADGLHLADPTELRARFAIDYPDEFKRSVVDELIDSGSVTVLNFEFTYRYEYGSD